MINEAIADLLERFTPGVWMEWSLHFNPDANRRLRICENEDWIESGPAIQGVRWRAYRITPLGQAALDIFLMSRLENSKKKGLRTRRRPKFQGAVAIAIATRRY